MDDNPDVQMKRGMTMKRSKLFFQASLRLLFLLIGNRSGGEERGQGSRDSMATSDGAYAHGTTAKSGLGGGSMGGGKWGRPSRK